MDLFCSVLVHDKVYIFDYNTSISITIHNGAMDYDNLSKMSLNRPNCASFYDRNKTFIAAVAGYSPIQTLIFDIEQNVWFQGMKTNEIHLVFSEKKLISKTYRASFY